MKGKTTGILLLHAGFTVANALVCLKENVEAAEATKV